MLYIYLNNDSQPTFMTYLQTTEFIFNFTDVNFSTIIDQQEGEKEQKFLKLFMPILINSPTRSLCSLRGGSANRPRIFQF